MNTHIFLTLQGNNFVAKCNNGGRSQMTKNRVILFFYLLSNLKLETQRCRLNKIQVFLQAANIACIVFLARLTVHTGLLPVHPGFLGLAFLSII